ncbi:uncharacterized protein N7500_008734 [Penicillium coprophilum]|uniref:uncharacterized protein n=1 Tax=Penicillium coprophilum TaxID=36646 RepID=UPI0023A13603|nr:uncharacterized protein N7500_008734 [Penicillium coprophilum]KAJ5159083.1 hypothetical protein N7500_008734 [Penicillium coprophilum]
MTTDKPGTERRNGAEEPSETVKSYLNQIDGGTLGGGIEGEAEVEEKADESTEERVHPIG